MTIELAFETVRSDWYAANTLIPRLFFRAICRRHPLVLVGFPAQWIPVCVHYGVGCRASVPPPTYLPLYSDLSVEELVRLAASAKAHRSSRSLLEATAALDPIIADLVYILDHKLAAAGFVDPSDGASNVLNTWHSFGRPEVVSLQERMCRHVLKNDAVLFLPCSRRRPYNASRTHVRILRQLFEAGHNPNAYSRVVVTALGVVPEAYWEDPYVMTYDAGAVDLWRVFQLLRVFLATNPFQIVVDCLSFKPYSEMIVTLSKLGLVRPPVRPLKLRWRGYYVALA